MRFRKRTGSKRTCSLKLMAMYGAGGFFDLLRAWHRRGLSDDGLVDCPVDDELIDGGVCGFSTEELAKLHA